MSSSPAPLRLTTVRSSVRHSKKATPPLKLPFARRSTATASSVRPSLLPLPLRTCHARENVVQPPASSSWNGANRRRVSSQRKMLTRLSHTSCRRASSRVAHHRKPRRAHLDELDVVRGYRREPLRLNERPSCALYVYTALATSRVPSSRRPLARTRIVCQYRDTCARSLPLAPPRFKRQPAGGVGGGLERHTRRTPRIVRKPRR